MRTTANRILQSFPSSFVGLNLGRERRAAPLVHARGPHVVFGKVGLGVGFILDCVEDVCSIFFEIHSLVVGGQHLLVEHRLHAHGHEKVVKHVHIKGHDVLHEGSAVRGHFVQDGLELVVVHGAEKDGPKLLGGVGNCGAVDNGLSFCYGFWS